MIRTVIDDSDGEDDVRGIDTEDEGLMAEDKEESMADPVTSEQVRYLSDRYQSLVDQVRWLGGWWILMWGMVGCRGDREVTEEEEEDGDEAGEDIAGECATGSEGKTVDR